MVLLPNGNDFDMFEVPRFFNMAILLGYRDLGMINDDTHSCGVLSAIMQSG